MSFYLQYSNPTHYSLGCCYCESRHSHPLPDVERLNPQYVYLPPPPYDTRAECEELMNKINAEQFNYMSREEALEMLNQRIREFNKPTNKPKYVERYIVEMLLIAFERRFYPASWKYYHITPYYILDKRAGIRKD